jgi:flagellar biosynthesis protein FlhA
MSVNLGGQLFRLSKVLYMAGGVLIFLGIFTPLPFFVLATFGAILMYIGSSIDRKEKIEEIESEITEEDEDVEEIRKPENVMELLQVDQIELEFGYGIIPLADIKQGGDLLDRVVMIRRQIATELGAVVPIVRLRDNIQLGPNEYIVKIKGTDVAKGTIMHGHYLAINQGFVDSEISGIETVEPAFNLPALWITEDQREEAEAKGYMVVDAPSLMATHLTEVIKNHLGELLTRQDIQLLVNKVKESAPALIEELVPKLMNLGEIQKVLANLLNEGISIRDLITVFETLADYATITKDPDMLTEYVRQGLSRPISRKYFEDGVNKVVTIDANLEQLIFKNIQSTEHGTYVAIDQNIVQKMLESVGRETAKFLAYGKNPIILASPVVRTHFKKMTEAYYKNLVVLSYSEVEPSIEIQSIGMVSIDEN